MKTQAMTFNGSIPQNYDDYLGDFLFEPYAVDLKDRIDVSNISKVLELACGTGRLTRHLAEGLAGDFKITATDLNSDMIIVAKEKISSPRISWATVDMSDIPYHDNEFDLIVSQFGLMFVPDKLKTFVEIRRTLNTGGKFIFNTWGDIAENKAWLITNQVINSFIIKNPIPVNQGPFSMNDTSAILQLLNDAGFKNARVSSVNKIAKAQNAASVAKGFIIGLPFSTVIQKFDPTLLPQIIKALEEAFIDQLGDAPFLSPLNALVFESQK